MQRVQLVMLRTTLLLSKPHHGKYVLPGLKNMSSQQSLFRYSTYYASLLKKNLCPSCLALHQKLFHSTAVLESAKKTSKKEQKARKNFKKIQPKLIDAPAVGVRENMTLQDIAAALDKDVDHVFDVLETMGARVKRKKSAKTEVITRLDDIREICRLSGRRTVIESKEVMVKENKDVVKQPPPDPKQLVKRPPVVTIMGHVDHGKTTLLDSLRHSNIVAKEFGGITQHIGAFSVKLNTGDTITFLDTPGHAAFATMRSRGAQITDIVVLVVAADDGVMEQTVESVKFAQEAKVPIIVAINKCDKPGADIDITNRGLLSIGVTPEDLGGDVQCVQVSALKRYNLDLLQDAIVVQAELMELKGDPKGLVEGVVIESKVEQGKGKVATVLIQRGTAEKGKVFVSGTAMAKVKRILNEDGKTLNQAGPGQAVEIIGWRDLPHPGDEILEVESEARAREVQRWRQEQATEQKMQEEWVVIEKKMQEHDSDYKARRRKRLNEGRKVSRLFGSERRTGETVRTVFGPELSIVIRGDVDGSVEAILDTISTYDSRQCHLNIINYDVGVVTEQDVENAAPSNGIIYAFNTKTPPDVVNLAKTRNVQIKEHNVIYRLVDDLREELTGRLEPIEEETIIGEANVIQSFMINAKKRAQIPVAGCRCTSGILNKKKEFKLVRNGETLLIGKVQSLKHLKNEVETIKKEVECGIMFEDTSVVPQPHDVVVCYERTKKPQELEWNLHF